VGKVVMSGPTQCEYCGTEYDIARYKNLPYTVAGLLAVIFVLAWLTGKLNGIVFLILGGVWLTFDLIWESLAPLQPVKHSRKNPPAPSAESNDIADESDRTDTKKTDANKLIG
jgi:hypothetical protein